MVKVNNHLIVMLLLDIPNLKKANSKVEIEKYYTEEDW